MSRSTFEVVMPPRSEASFARALVEDFGSLVRKTCAVKVEDATAREAADESNIKRAIREDMGGFDVVDTVVIGALREWMVAAGRAALAELPEDVRLVSVLQIGLANLLRDQGNFAEAEPLYREALAGWRRALGDAHPCTLTSVNNLAVLLSDVGKYAEAEPLYREALAGGRSAHGDAHPDTLRSMDNLAVLLIKMGDYEDAEALCREALAGWRRTLGDAHVDTLTSINNFAVLQKIQGKYDEAEPLLSEALAGQRIALGDAHPSTLLTVSNLANLLSDRGRCDEAEPLYREALAGNRKALGDAHPDTLVCVFSFVVFLKRRDKVGVAVSLLVDILASAVLSDEQTGQLLLTLARCIPATDAAAAAHAARAVVLLTSVIAHPHPLDLKDAGYALGRFCDICRAPSMPLCSTCDACGFDVCPECAPLVAAANEA